MTKAPTGLLRLGSKVRIGNTVWLGYIAAVDRDPGWTEIRVCFPSGQFHDGGWAVYKAELVTGPNDVGELVVEPGSAEVHHGDGR